MSSIIQQTFVFTSLQKEFFESINWPNSTGFLKPCNILKYTELYFLKQIQHRIIAGVLKTIS